MTSNIWQDERNWTFVDWELDGVTAKMVDWFWCNMEKCDILWHPGQHYGLSWAKGRGVVDLKSPLNTVHIAPQKWDDGKMQDLHIRIEALDNVPEEVRDIIKYDHVVIAGGDASGGIDNDPDHPASSWRVHQWQKTDGGIVGMSAGMNRSDVNDMESGLIWAAHGSEEIANWEVFLPELYRLYKAVSNPEISPYYSFRVEGRGRDAKYTEL